MQISTQADRQEDCVSLCMRTVGIFYREIWQFDEAFLSHPDVWLSHMIALLLISITIISITYVKSWHITKLRAWYSTSWTDLFSNPNVLLWGAVSYPLPLTRYPVTSTSRILHLKQLHALTNRYGRFERKACIFRSPCLCSIARVAIIWRATHSSVKEKQLAREILRTKGILTQIYQ